MSAEITPGQGLDCLPPDGTGTPDTVSPLVRLAGGIKHAFINGEISVEEAEARLKLIAELNTSDYPTEDK